MRDSLGGSVTLIIIVFFMVVVLSYLAFNVNFTKASRMKNKIIATYEEFNGDCSMATTCQSKIIAYAKEIGYDVGRSSLNCTAVSGYSYGPGNTRNLFCVKEVAVDKNDTNKKKGIYSTSKRKKYYKIATRINIELPIIQNIFDYQMFWITGNTKTFTR